jgi:hypothetical protein
MVAWRPKRVAIIKIAIWISIDCIIILLRWRKCHLIIWLYILRVHLMYRSDYTYTSCFHLMKEGGQSTKRCVSLTKMLRWKMSSIYVCLTIHHCYQWLTKCHNRNHYLHHTNYLRPGIRFNNFSSIFVLVCQYSLFLLVCNFLASLVIASIPFYLNDMSISVYVHPFSHVLTLP